MSKGLLAGFIIGVMLVLSVGATPALQGLPEVIVFVQELDSRVSALEAIPQLEPGTGYVRPARPRREEETPAVQLTGEPKRDALLILSLSHSIPGDLYKMSPESIDSWYTHFERLGLVP